MHQHKEPHRKGTVLYHLALILLLAVFAVSSFFVIRYFLDARAQKSRYDELAALVEAVKESTPAATIPLLFPADPEIGVQTEAPEEPSVPEEPRVMLPEYASIYELNPDVVGWISIENSRVNYPVMQTPDNPDFYLNHNFDGKRNARGCIYAEEDCDLNLPSDNITLYGHHMNDGSMFAGLMYYTRSSYWETHRCIQFDTLYEHHTYEIFAVFTTSASVGKGFRYHSFIDAEDQEDFDAFISQCIELSLYDTGIVPQYGDKILCLSTCEYSQENGRLVVAAVRTG